MHTLPDSTGVARAATTTWLGDLLIAFDTNTSTAAPTASRTVAPWRLASLANGWQLYTQPQTHGWHGFPALVGETGPWRYWFLGELAGDAPPAAAVVDLLHGRSTEAALNGQFLLFAWHELAREWHIWTDRFGTLHAYHAADGRRAAIGTLFAAVADAASGRELDWDGLTGLFSLGFFAGDRTYYRDLRILRPATHTVLDSYGRLLRSRRTWHWQHAPNRARSFDDTVAAFADCLHTIVDEQTSHGRVALPISGGLDSRSLVAALGSRHARPLQAYSYGYAPDSVETQIAARVARVADLPFQRFTVPTYLFDRLAAVTAQVEGFQDVTQTRQAGIIDQFAGQIDAILGGHLGDLWLDDMGIVGNASPDVVLDTAVSRMQKGGRDWLQTHLLQPQLGPRRPSDLVRDQVAAELQPLAAIADADYRLKALKTDQWVFRWTNASLRAFQSVAFPRLPFYDARLADFISTVPVEMLSGRRLQIAYLCRFAPDLARITWQQYDANLFRYQHFHTWQLPRRALKKAWRTLMQHHVIERNWEVQLLGDHGRGGLERWLLRPGLLLHELVTPAAIAELLAGFFANPRIDKRGYTVSMLLTFSSWLELQHGSHLPLERPAEYTQPC